MQPENEQDKEALWLKNSLYSSGWAIFHLYNFLTQIPVLVLSQHGQRGKGSRANTREGGVVWGISEQAQIALLPASTSQAEDSSFKINKLRLFYVLHFISPLLDSRMVIKLAWRCSIFFKFSFLAG